MTRKVTLIIFTLIAFFYCFRFGYIWSAYGHGGQLLGVPFVLIMLITTLLFFAAKTNVSKSRLFSFGIVYFLTLAAFSITIETIRATVRYYFQFLYYQPGGYVDKIFLGWLVLGAIVLVFMFRKTPKIKVEENIL